MQITDEHRAAVYAELMADDHDMCTAMLSAAFKIPLERENGGLEYPPIKVFRAMLMAAAAVRGVKL